MDQWESSELEQNCGISCKEKSEVEVHPVVDLIADSVLKMEKNEGSFFLSNAIQMSKLNPRSVSYTHLTLPTILLV